MSQLAHRVFGPLRPARTRAVLDYHGLLDRPAGSLVQIGRRHHVTPRTVSNNVATVRVAGPRLPLPGPLIAEATRASAPGEDHRGRVRIAATLGLPVPAAAPADTPPPERGATAAQLTAARAAVRVIAAAGPLDLPSLAAVIARTRRSGPGTR